MSLYTPVFPSTLESSTSRRGLPENTSTSAPGKRQSYAEFLRDVHLFLSTQSDMLAPSSRPNSPLFDRRVQKVKDEVQDIFNVTGRDTSNGNWTRVSQVLKLGCVRGRHWSVTKANPCTPEEDTNWILPDEESEWIEWEKKKEEDRRLKATTNAQHSDNATSPAHDSRTPNLASLVELSQSHRVARERPPPGVSPTTLRAAKEKVRKWQVSVAWHDSTTTCPSSSTREVAAASTAKGKIEIPQRSRTLDFAVVKPTAKSVIAKRGKGVSSRLAARGASVPVVLPKLPEPSKLSNVSVATAHADVDETDSQEVLKTSPVKNDRPKIANLPETPYLPPSFPTHLETSTPLPDPLKPVRAKPSLILPLPASSSTPPPSTPADPPDDHQLFPAVPHAANASSLLQPQITTVQSGKRSRASATSLDGILDDPPVTPPAKRLRTLSQKGSTPSVKHSKPVSPNAGLDLVPSTREDAPDTSLEAAPSQRYDADSFEMAIGAPLTPGKNKQPVQGADIHGFPEKITSPTKSVKSYFSAADSDPADSPLKSNLLLESPVSPMLSYAQNPSGFLPQITSTQTGKGSPTAEQTNRGMFGMGYSSQFDVERHVDRVSEMLEKDVDFDGWLRDVRTVETSQD